MDEAARQEIERLQKENEQITRHLALVQARMEHSAVAAASLAGIHAMQESKRKRQQQYLQLLI